MTEEERNEKINFIADVIMALDYDRFILNGLDISSLLDLIVVNGIQN